MTTENEWANDRSTSQDIAMRPHAHHIPATDYLMADWEGGTLARIRRNRERTRWAWLAAFAVSIIFWGAVIAWLAT